MESTASTSACLCFVTWDRLLQFSTSQHISQDSLQILSPHLRSIHIIRYDTTRHDTTRHDTTHARLHSHLPAMTDRIFSSHSKDTLCLSLSLLVGDRPLWIRTCQIIQKYFIVSCRALQHNVNRPLNVSILCDFFPTGFRLRFLICPIRATLHNNLLNLDPVNTPNSKARPFALSSNSPANSTALGQCAWLTVLGQTRIKYLQALRLLK
jgi:hypothetical protein